MSEDGSDSDDETMSDTAKLFPIGGVKVILLVVMDLDHEFLKV